MAGRLLESAGADILTISNKWYLCTIDYHSKFHAVNQVEGLSIDNQIKTCKITFSKYGISSKQFLMQA